MTTKTKADRGKELIAVGVLLFTSAFLWFVMDSFWPPLGIFTLPPLDHPQTIYNIFLRAEFIVSATLAAVGTIMLRSASRKLFLLDYMIALLCAFVPVLCVFKMAEWVHYPN